MPGMAVLVALDLVAARHHEHAAVDAHHLDLGAVQARQRRAGNDLVHRAERRVPVAEVQHPVERAEQRIQLVRAEQHGDPQLPLQLAHQLHHALLMRRVETDERLVEEQQAWLAEQRLREQQSLALPARELGERAPGKRARADAIERRGDVAPRGSSRDRHTEPMSVDGARDEIPSAQPAWRNVASDLGQVADRRVAAHGRPAEHADLAAHRRDEPEDGAHEGRLARAVRPQHADEFRIAHREIHLVQEPPPADRERDAAEFDRAQGRAPDRARSSESSSESSHC